MKHFLMMTMKMRIYKDIKETYKDYLQSLEIEQLLLMLTRIYYRYFVKRMQSSSQNIDDIVLVFKLVSILCIMMVVVVLVFNFCVFLFWDEVIKNHYILISHLIYNTIRKLMSVHNKMKKKTNDIQVLHTFRCLRNIM